MKIFPAIALCLVTGCVSLHDTEISLYDEAHSLDRDGYKKRLQIWNELSKEAADFIQAGYSLAEALDRLDRMVFLYKLTTSPNSIDWKDPYKWTDVIAMGTEEYESFKTTIPGFKGIAEECERLRANVLTKNTPELSDSMYHFKKKNTERLVGDPLHYHAKMLELQKRMDKVRKQYTQPPSPGDAEASAPEK